jgi:hypothetical protein
MSTKAGTIGFSGRPALFTFWTVAVSALAAAALILSAVALTVAGRGDGSVTSAAGSGIPGAASIGPRLWDAVKLDAKQGRVPQGRPLRSAAVGPAFTMRAVCSQRPLVWESHRGDAGKLEAMQGRVLAESARIQGSAPLWDAVKLDAMQGRVLAG